MLHELDANDDERFSESHSAGLLIDNWLVNTFIDSHRPVGFFDDGLLNSLLPKNIPPLPSIGHIYSTLGNDSPFASSNPTRMIASLKVVFQGPLLLSASAKTPVFSPVA